MKLRHLYISVLSLLIILLGVGLLKNKIRKPQVKIRASGVTFKSTHVKTYKIGRNKIKPVAIGLFEFTKPFKKGDKIKSVIEFPAINYIRSRHKLALMINETGAELGYMYEFLNGEAVHLPEYSFDIGVTPTAFTFSLHKKLSDNTDVFIGKSLHTMIGVSVRL